jgi:hypothetical protein
VANLAKTQAQWTRLLGRELGGLILAPIRIMRELEDLFSRERIQIWNLGDRASSTPHITALTLAGVDYGNNTSTEGRLYVRFVVNGGNWDVKLFKATGGGGSDEVARATNVAASATGTLSAQNSSGLTGSVTLGASITADATDLHQLLVQVDFPARLPKVLTQTDSIDDDQFSRQVLSEAYATCARNARSSINALKRAGERWALSDGQRNPVARGNAFSSTAETALVRDETKDDGDGNISRRRTGWFYFIKDAMEDEGTGGEQDLVRVVPSATAGSFESGNDGQGAVASHTPQEKCPAGRWTFRCVKGVDTGDLGAEEFEGEFASTTSDEESFTFSGVVVKKSWTGPRGFGPISITRTYTKSGDNSHLNLANGGVTVVGETNDNTDGGILYWQIDSNASNWDISFFSSSTRTSQYLVAKATNKATAAAFEASPQNSSGLTVNWTVGSAPVNGTQGTLDVNGFHVENSGGVPDQFSITTSVAASPGLYQTILGEEFDAQLNSDTSGSESIPDNYVKQGTFPPFVALDN